ncbi:acyl-CoA dehydrogenase family protein [Microcella alkaliphila]|uniref:Uncharacterized conserved protein n=1 Tax=Microcella alkaliphila TaxID=279828 RepID=A0A0U5BJP5_9MICO|nr:acyl-CoA dehydrogenase family protein [Microcella alkaliphila]BAU33342.1 uncharacterized conserved protein [Microcella alkaliphila]
MTITTATDLAATLAALRDAQPERERERRLLHREVRALADAGFGSLRVPVEFGGAGARLHQVIAHQIDIARADASLGHLWRGHIAFVEKLRYRGLEVARWYPRLVAGDVIGNAQSERHDTARLDTVLARQGSTLTLSGTKYYTTGSIYADWIHLAALDGDERVAVTVAASQDGVESVDDWDGFGQLLTGSGTTRFENAVVDGDEVHREDDDAALWPLLGSVFQLSLLATIAGIAQRAHDDLVAYVVPRRRTFGFAGETLPREDPLVQHVVGEVSGAASAARRLVLSAVGDLDEIIDAGYDRDALQELQWDVYRLQRVVPDIVLDATTRLFEVGGASAVSVRYALDRHWRNVRTIASHNPVAQRTRAIGQWELTGTRPDWKAPGR